VVGDNHEASIVKLWQKWHQAGRLLVAPTLLYYEVCNALHRYAIHQVLLPEEAAEALEAALDLDVILYGEAGLHRRALEIAERFSLPAAYDAHYLALAEELGAEFWTADQRLLQAVSGTLPWVHQATV
jgi:predicted nucleic acid-binding protein